MEERQAVETDGRDPDDVDPRADDVRPVPHVPGRQHRRHARKEGDEDGVKGKPVKHAAEKRQHHADEKSQTDMEKKRHEDRDGADGNAVRGEALEPLAELDDAHPQDHEKPDQENGLVIVDELRKIGADIEDEEEREHGDEARQGDDPGKRKSDLRQKQRETSWPRRPGSRSASGCGSAGPEATEPSGAGLRFSARCTQSSIDWSIRLRPFSHQVAIVSAGPPVFPNPRTPAGFL